MDYDTAFSSVSNLRGALQFHPIALATHRLVKRTATLLIDFTRDGAANPPPPQKPTKLLAAAAFVAHYPLWTAARTTPPAASDFTLFQQVFSDASLMTFTAAQHKRHRFATAFRSQVDFGAETTLTATHCFRVPANRARVRRFAKSR